MEHALSPDAMPEDREHGNDRTAVASAGAPIPVAEAPRAGRRRWRLIGLLLLVVLAVAGGTYWYVHRNLVSTDDAFIDGNAIVIAPRVGGTVLHLWMVDNQQVRTGDRLLQIDPRDYQAALDDAAARLAQATAHAQSVAADLQLTHATTAADIARAESALEGARAQVARAQADVVARQAEYDRAHTNLPRYEALAKANAASREALDQAIAAERTSAANLKSAQRAVEAAAANVAEAQAQLAQARTAPQQIAVKEADAQAAQAEVEAAQAAVDQARLNLSYTSIAAPADGYITKRSVNEGDVVQKEQTLSTLVSGQPWVTANFKETQLTRMRPGQPVEIRVDAYPDTPLRGRVDSIQRGTGARFSLLPPENATGNFVKVVQRVPVKIVFDAPPPADLPLGLGMSVVPTVDVGAALPPAPAAIPVVRTPETP